MREDSSLSLMTEVSRIGNGLSGLGSVSRGAKSLATVHIESLIVSSLTASLASSVQKKSTGTKIKANLKAGLPLEVQSRCGMKRDRKTKDRRLAIRADCWKNESDPLSAWTIPRKHPDLIVSGFPQRKKAETIIRSEHQKKKTYLKRRCGQQVALQHLDNGDGHAK